ncbi:MAG: GNAT family N-acetyltransferase [Pseudomonadota bacterium]|nr:GNAT family N-acetyltransferase [Pseudomonadota bacterium]
MSFALRTSCESSAPARFNLRPLAAGDEVLYHDIYCHPETMRYVGAPLSTGQATRSFLAALKQNAEPLAEVRFLVAVDDSSGIASGICGATIGVPRLGSAEIGIMLTSSARGQGFSHEILGRFIDYVFATFEVEQVWVRYAVEQAAVVLLNRGLGFVVSERLSPDDDARWTAYIRRDAWHGFINSTNRG